MFAIPAPKLWTPRRGPWWRLPRFDSLAMAHLKKSAATGHLLKTATGHLSKGCGGTGCYCEGLTCRVILDSVAYCNCDLDGAVYRKLSADINGTWDLSFVSNSGLECAFALTTSVTMQTHSNSSCTALISESTVGFKVRLQAGGSTILTVGTVGGGTQIFYVPTGTQTDCAGTTFSNDNGGPCGSSSQYGWNGTADVSFF